MKTEKYYWVLILLKIRIEQFFSKWAKICLFWTYKPTCLITLIVDKVNNQYDCRWWEERHCLVNQHAGNAIQLLRIDITESFGNLLVDQKCCK